MLRLKSIMSGVAPKIIILVISFLLIISAVLGLLSSYRVDALRADVANANAARDAAEHRRVTQKTELKTRETAVAEGEAKIAEAENKIAELAQLQKDKTELQTDRDPPRVLDTEHDGPRPRRATLRPND
jgi:hypothetical protein